MIVVEIKVDPILMFLFFIFFFLGKLPVLEFLFCGVGEVTSS